MKTKPRRLLPALAVAAMAAIAAPAQADVTPFGTLACAPRDGVRHCEGTTATRVKTFDGVPLDVNVTLPASGDTALPLAVILHGWGGRKASFAETRPWAERGYAVLSYTARGFGESCGSPSSRLADPAGCAKGWIHLADVRYEARDTQHLAGLLADQGIVHPQRIGVTGVSYGGGQSLELATLRDRMMLPDGTLVPWRSPGGTPMRIAASAPVIPWSDLVSSLVPNGRQLDYGTPAPAVSLDPVGIKKESYVDGLMGSGAASGYYAPPGADPGADLPGWFARLSAGEPYADPFVTGALREIATHHSPLHLYAAQRAQPAPLFISNGFTDDLFPVDEAVRYANVVLADHPRAVLAQLHFDFGHARGQNKPADQDRLRTAIDRFFDRYVKGDAASTPPTGVEAMTQTCPRTAPSGGPLRARTWDALSAGEVRYTAPGPQTLNSLGGDPAVARTIDPIAGGGDPCATTSSASEAGTAEYRLPAVVGAGYTLLGSPTIVADLAITGLHAQVAARLWDVRPDGTQRLAARSVLRPRSSGRVVFQLHPNGYRFGAGHVPKLQLLGRDAPYARPSNGAFTVTVSSLELRLPVHERAGGNAHVKRPLPPPAP